MNLEYLAQTVWTRAENGEEIAYPDTLVGTDSHTTMVNGLAVLGWGVGGIEAEAAMLGQPISMLIPEVIGFKFTGKLPEGITATDLALHVTEMLRKKRGGQVRRVSMARGSPTSRSRTRRPSPTWRPNTRLRLFFPIDAETIKYLNDTGREPDRVALVEAYAKAQGMFRADTDADPVFTDTLELDLSTVVPSLAGPKRPQDRVALADAATAFVSALDEITGGRRDNRELPGDRVESRFIDEGATGVSATLYDDDNTRATPWPAPITASMTAMW